MWPPTVVTAVGGACTYFCVPCGVVQRVCGVEGCGKKCRALPRRRDDVKDSCFWVSVVEVERVNGVVDPINVNSIGRNGRVPRTTLHRECMAGPAHHAVRSVRSGPRASTVSVVVMPASSASPTFRVAATRRFRLASALPPQTASPPCPRGGKAKNDPVACRRRGAIVPQPKYRPDD